MADDIVEAEEAVDGGCDGVENGIPADDVGFPPSGVDARWSAGVSGMGVLSVLMGVRAGVNAVESDIRPSVGGVNPRCGVPRRRRGTEVERSMSKWNLLGFTRVPTPSP